MTMINRTDRPTLEPRGDERTFTAIDWDDVPDAPPTSLDQDWRAMAQELVMAHPIAMKSLTEMAFRAPAVRFRIKDREGSDFYVILIPISKGDADESLG